MKTPNGNNKLERQLNFLKNYLNINVKHYSNKYLIVEKELLTNNHFLTNRQPKLINGKFGLCFKFEFDNGTLFVSKAKAICCDNANVLSDWIIYTENPKWKDLANGADDLIFAKDFKFDILIEKNGKRDLFETQEAINKIYNQTLKS